jgi:F-box interacting protein
MRGVFREIQPCYVFALGCNQLRPRCVGRPPEQVSFFDASALASGNLHWSWWPLFVRKDQSQKMITVFDTIAESFRLMRGPVVRTSTTYLYEVDDTLGMYSCNDSITTVDIWVMQDYANEVWSHKYHVKLPVAEIKEYTGQGVIVVHEGRDVFVAYKFQKKLFLVDIKGKLLDSSQLDGSMNFGSTHRIKESLVQQSFFSALQSAPLNAWSFI